MLNRIIKIDISEFPEISNYNIFDALDYFKSEDLKKIKWLKPVYNSLYHKDDKEAFNYIMNYRNVNVGFNHCILKNDNTSLKNILGWIDNLYMVNTNIHIDVRFTRKQDYDFYDNIGIELVVTKFGGLNLSGTVELEYQVDLYSTNESVRVFKFNINNSGINIIKLFEWSI